jgi:Animal haem peroxidase
MLDLKHGGHVLPEDAPGAHDAEDKLGVRLAKKPPQGTPFDYLLPKLKTKPESRLPGDPVKVAADLKALGAAMVDDAPAGQTDPAVEVNSTIPAVYTYWGQFIDHDMTANTDRDSTTSDITKTPLTPIDPAVVTTKLRNLRRPTFDLDNVYGNGPGLNPRDFHPDPGPPDKGFYDGVRMRVGANADGPGIPGVKIPPEADLQRDLPRIGELLKQGVITENDIPESLKNDVTKQTRAFIGDLRNDENLIVSQFHLAFLRFHNNVVDTLEAKPDAFNFLDELLGDLLGDLLKGKGKGGGDARRFAQAQRLVRWHYQWLVVNDYLKTVTLPGIVDKVLVGGNRFYNPLPGNTLFAPLEYSVAAFRFGHTMVRGGYDHNRNFGRAIPPAKPVLPFAPFDELFRFTGNGHAIDPNDITKSTPNPFRGLPTLPFNWIIEWDRFSSKTDPNEGHFARKLDTRLAPPILNMVNEGTADGIQDDAANPGNKAIRQLLRSLAQRNLLRGYLLSIPTGQAMADEMKVAKLSEAELRQGNSDAVNAALEGGGFLQNTPLWFYVLKEAEVRANGNSLGELGSRIVVETQIGLLRNDANSYLNAKGGWNPSKGVRLPNGDPITTIRDFFAFADLAA